MSVKIYTKDGCPYCSKAIQSLWDRGIDFQEINLTKDPDKINEMEELSGARKVPVIVENHSVTVGFEGLG